MVKHDVDITLFWSVLVLQPKQSKTGVLGGSIILSGMILIFEGSLEWNVDIHEEFLRPNLGR